MDSQVGYASQGEQVDWIGVLHQVYDAQTEKAFESSGDLNLSVSVRLLSDRRPSGAAAEAWNAPPSTFHLPDTFTGGDLMTLLAARMMGAMPRQLCMLSEPLPEGGARVRQTKLDRYDVPPDELLATLLERQRKGGLVQGEDVVWLGMPQLPTLHLWLHVEVFPGTLSVAMGLFSARGQALMATRTGAGAMARLQPGVSTAAPEAGHEVELDAAAMADGSQQAMHAKLAQLNNHRQEQLNQLRRHTKQVEGGNVLASGGPPALAAAVVATRTDSGPGLSKRKRGRPMLEKNIPPTSNAQPRSGRPLPAVQPLADSAGGLPGSAERFNGVPQEEEQSHGTEEDEYDYVERGRQGRQGKHVRNGGAGSRGRGERTAMCTTVAPLQQAKGQNRGSIGAGRGSGRGQVRNGVGGGGRGAAVTEEHPVQRRSARRAKPSARRLANLAGMAAANNHGWEEAEAQVEEAEELADDEVRAVGVLSMLGGRARYASGQEEEMSEEFGPFGMEEEEGGERRGARFRRAAHVKSQFSAFLEEEDADAMAPGRIGGRGTKESQQDDYDYDPETDGAQGRGHFDGRWGAGKGAGRKRGQRSAHDRPHDVDSAAGSGSVRMRGAQRPTRGTAVGPRHHAPVSSHALGPATVNGSHGAPMGASPGRRLLKRPTQMPALQQVLALAGQQQDQPQNQLMLLPPNMPLCLHSQAWQEEEDLDTDSKSKQQALQGVGGWISQRAYGKWTAAEEVSFLEAILLLVEHQRGSKWKHVKDLAHGRLSDRTTINLKDKWRTFESALSKNLLDDALRDLVTRCFYKLNTFQDRWPQDVQW